MSFQLASQETDKFQLHWVAYHFLVLLAFFWESACLVPRNWLISLSFFLLKLVCQLKDWIVLAASELYFYFCSCFSRNIASTGRSVTDESLAIKVYILLLTRKKSKVSKHSRNNLKVPPNVHPYSDINSSDLRLLNPSSNFRVLDLCESSRSLNVFWVSTLSLFSSVVTRI